MHLEEKPFFKALSVQLLIRNALTCVVYTRFSVCLIIALSIIMEYIVDD